MRKGIVNLAGELFKFVNPATKEAERIVSSYRFFYSRYGNRNIYQAYKRPSDIKCEIWRDWLTTFGEIEYVTGGSLDVTVLGASSHTFSIGAYDSINHVLYYITKSYNKAIEGVYLW